MLAYLTYMAERLAFCHELLKETGAHLGILIIDGNFPHLQRNRETLGIQIKVDNTRQPPKNPSKQRFPKSLAELTCQWK